MACRDDDGGVTVRVDEALAPVFTDFVGFIGDDRLTLEVDEHPTRRLRRDPDAVAISLELDCAGCYQIRREGDGLIVAAGDGLGAQYGLADVLEQAGWRFHHPYESMQPAEASLAAVVADDAVVTAHQSVRGLQPHTLHPIEGLFDLWVPSDENLDGAKRIIDWLVKNRGNQLQYPGLDDILESSARQPWLTHTNTILDYAHERGIRVGVGVQLFSSGNLQLAYDLSDATGDEATDRAQMESRLQNLLGETDFDLVNLSFGEFSGEDPADFVASCDMAYEAMQEAQPGVEVSTIVHVGNYEDLRVDYMGEEDILYYFLVKYADPAMIPYVHSVMFYNLFEDAGDAYEHDLFDEHRAFLMDYLSQGRPVAYFPESAYWIAFDINMPLYLPVYWMSRWTDFDGIDAEAAQIGASPLDQHVLFSSGWEWGYWATDVLTLRQGFVPFDDWRDGYAWLWQGRGGEGEALAQAQIALAQLEHDALIVERLAPWMAGRDQIIDLGDGLGIHSQPDRPDLDEIAAYDAATAESFRTSVVDGLTTFAVGVEAVGAGLDGATDRWSAEVQQGVEVTALRARFAAAITAGALDVGAGGDAGEMIEEATALLAEAGEVVAARHADLHDPRPERLLVEAENPTLYDFGYLLRAEELCFWTRELAQLENLAGGDVSVPGCAL